MKESLQVVSNLWFETFDLAAKCDTTGFQV